jgi:hypothetical protein
MEIKDILAMLKTDLLTEEQQAEIKQSIEDIIDLKVQDKLNEMIESEKETLIELYEEKFETYKQDITSKFSDFVDTVLEEEMVIPEELKEFARKGELYNDLIEEFKVRIGIDEGVMEDEVRDLLKEAKEEIVKLRDELNISLGEVLETKSDAKKLAAEIYKREKCDGLTESQRKQVMSLLEGVDDTKDIDRKFDVIVNHYLNEGDDKETDDSTTSCVCPECDKTYNVKGACNMNECDECGGKLKEKVAEAHAEVKTEKIEETTHNDNPFDDYKKTVVKVLKENKF